MKSFYYTLTFLTMHLGAYGYLQTVDPYSIIEAENYQEQNGIQLSNNNTAVGFINNNDWIKFENVEFGRGPLQGIILASSNTTGGIIEFRSGSPDGPRIATSEISNTNGWTNFENFEINVINSDDYANGTTFLGTIDLFLVFKGGNGFLLDVDSLSFESANIPVTALSFSNCPDRDLIVGESYDLDVLLTPTNPSNPTVAFTSSDGTSVDFLSGEFTASSPGTYTITATSFDNGAISDQCIINVVEESSALLNPYNTIETETFNDQNGVRLSNNNTAVGYINTNDWIKFNNLEFDRGPRRGNIVASSNTNGGTVEFRSGSPDGVLIATSNITNTGGWTNFQNFEITVINPDDYANGTLFLGTIDLFIVFEGGNGFLLDVDAFSFESAYIPVTNLSFSNCPDRDLVVGETYDLDVTFTPENPTNPFVAFSSSDGTSVDYVSGEFTALVPGTYTVSATSFDNGSFSDRCIINVVDDSSINTLSAITSSEKEGHKTNPMVYPNPSKGIYFVKLSSEEEITITNLYGRTIYQKVHPVGTSKIDVSFTKEGLLFLKLRNNSYKLLKE